MIDLLTKLDSWGEGIGEIAGVTREAAAEIRGLRAIVDRLPKDADGNPLTLGDERASHGSPCVVLAISEDWVTVQQWGGNITRTPRELYGSAESERAARETEKARDDK